MIHAPISVRGNQEIQALPTFLPEAQKNLKSCFLYSSPPDLLCSVLNIVSTDYFYRIKLRDYMIYLKEQSFLEAEISTTNGSLLKLLT